MRSGRFIWSISRHADVIDAEIVCSGSGMGVSNVLAEGWIGNNG